MTKRFAGAPPDCPRCPDLVKNRSQVVNGTGSGESGVMFIGEAPGKQEDEQGEPFVGRSGSLLDEALEAAGIEREEVRISNVVRCRPPGNRDPKRSEVQNCHEYLVEEVASVGPDVVCVLGRVAAGALLGESVTLRDVVGTERDLELDGESYPLIINYHPAATIYDRSKTGKFRAVIERVVERAQKN